MASLRPLVAGNWKMHGTRAALAELRILRDAVAAGELGSADLLVCPPFTLLMAAADLCAGTALLIGGQDCDPEPSGAATGDISAEMVRDAGAGFVIVGHSERRSLHRESDAVVRTKVAAARRAGLLPILCVGETRSERDAGRADEVIGRQLAGSLPDGLPAEGFVVAYEPVWAVGTGVTPTAADIAEVHGFIRRRLGGLLAADAGGTRLLYGGSVKAGNAAEVAAVPDVNGVLVGGASLRAADFLRVAAAFR